MRQIDVLVKFPSRQRPAVFAETFRAWQCADVRFLVTLDEDDPALDRYVAMLRRQPNVKVRIGHSRNKVEAINDGVADEPFDLLILAADDMIPQRPDYARRITGFFLDAFPDLDGVLHLNDGRTGRKLNTLPIMGRPYFDRFGYIYHPSYQSLWCDNEFQEVAERDGKSVYRDEVIIAHAWTDVTGVDDLCKRNAIPDRRDAINFQTRKAAGFPR